MSFLTSPVVLLSFPAILFVFFALSSPTGKYYVRSGIYLICLAIVVVFWGAMVAVVMFIQGRRYDVNWVIGRTFYYVAGRVLDIKVEVEDEGHLMTTRPAVFLSNHQSFLDILLLARTVPKRTSVVAKKSLQWTPLGPFLTASGAICIDRGNNTRAVKSLETAGELMKEDRVSVWMYPEGTRRSSEKSDLLPFKKGAFHLAIQAGLPVVPVVAENYWRLYHKGFFGSGVIKIRVLPPIPTSGITTKDMSTFIERVRNEMLKAYRDIS